MILLRKKIERAMRWAKERTGGAKKTEDGEAESGLPVEKHDFLAMVIAALVVIVPVALAALLLMCLIGSLFLSM